MMFMGSTLFTMVIMFVTNSFKKPSERYMKIVGDLVILQLCYNIICFSMVSPEHAFNIGYVPIGFTGFYVLLILIFVVIGTIRVIKFKIALYCFKRNLRKQKAFIKTWLKTTRTGRIERFKKM